MGCPFKCRENQAKTRHKFNKPQSFAACGFRKTAMLSVGGRSYQIGVHPLWPETYPTLPIRAYSSRVLSGGNASGNFRKSGKDRRFGSWENPRAGEVQSNHAILGKTDCRGGWSKGSQQPQHQPKTSALPMDRPSFPSFNSQTRKRAWQRGERCRTIMHHSHAADMKTATLGLPFLINARECCGTARGRWCRCLP